MADKEYIEREVAECVLKRLRDKCGNDEMEFALNWALELLDIIPAADVVAAEAFKQVMWERDIALSQLAEIGKGLGAKMDDVRPVVTCRDCKHKGWIQEPEHGKSVDYCRLIERCVDKKFFCAAGERKTNCGADMRESDAP